MEMAAFDVDGGECARNPLRGLTSPCYSLEAAPGQSQRKRAAVSGTSCPGLPD